MRYLKNFIEIYENKVVNLKLLTYIILLFFIDCSKVDKDICFIL